MNLKEALKSKKDEFLGKILETALARIGAGLDECQREDEYVRNFYRLKVTPSYNRDKYITINGIITTDDSNMEYDLPCFITCRKEETVNVFLELFFKGLNEEGFDILFHISDFSEELMKEDVEITLLEAVIEWD